MACLRFVVYEICLWNRMLSWMCFILLFYWRKGPCENRQEGGRRWNLRYVIYVYIIGGRGRARTGRRGKTVITLFLYWCIFTCYLEEGAEREPVGGGRRWKSYYVYEYNIYITWRKGPSGSRQKGEDGDNYIYSIMC